MQRPSNIGDRSHARTNSIYRKEKRNKPAEGRDNDTSSPYEEVPIRTKIQGNRTTAENSLRYIYRSLSVIPELAKPQLVGRGLLAPKLARKKF